MKTLDEYNKEIERLKLRARVMAGVLCPHCSYFGHKNEMYVVEPDLTQFGIAAKQTVTCPECTYTGTKLC